jgi:hypothetical protein
MSTYDAKKPSRRAFLSGAAAVGAGVVTSSAAHAQTADPLIVEPQDWAQSFGDGVDVTPYGLPIEHEGDVIRRNVEPRIRSVRSISHRSMRLMARLHRKAALSSGTTRVQLTSRKAIID